MSARSGGVTQPAWLTPPDLALLVLVNAIWGVNLLAAKVGVGEFPPLFFVALRFLLVLAVLWPTLRMFRGQMTTMMQAAVLTGALCFATMYVGFKLAGDVSSIAIATQLGVPFSTLLSIWLLGESIRWRRKLGIALAFGGVAIISFDADAHKHALGLTLVVVSQFSGALGLIYIKRLRNVNPWQLQAWIGAVSAPALLALSLMVEGGQWQALQDATWIGWSCLLFTAVISALGAHTLMFHLIAKYPVTSIAPINVLSPVFSILCGVIWYGERLTLRVVVGGAVALAGVIVVAMRDKRMAAIGA